MSVEKPCTKCGVLKPLEEFKKDRRRPGGRGSSCKACVSLHTQQYASQNPEKRAASVKRYTQGAGRERRKEYYEEHKEYLYLRRQEWLRQTGYAREYASKRRAQVRSSATDDAKELEMIREFYEQCPEGYHVDHIIPIALGGRHELANLQWLEASLNISKHAQHPDDWNDPRPIGCRG